MWFKKATFFACHNHTQCILMRSDKYGKGKTIFDKRSKNAVKENHINKMSRNSQFKCKLLKNIIGKILW